MLRRTRPLELTESGQAVVRFARQLDMLSADLAEELQPGVPHARARLALVVNSDSLHTWALPAPGRTGRRLGIMRYLPACTPEFAGVWLGGGVTAETLAQAPVITYDRKDDLQDRFLRRFSRRPLQPPRHYVPAAHEFGAAIRLGMGWGLLPEIEIAADRSGSA